MDGRVPILYTITAFPGHKQIEVTSSPAEFLLQSFADLKKGGKYVFTVCATNRAGKGPPARSLPLESSVAHHTPINIDANEPTSERLQKIQTAVNQKVGSLKFIAPDLPRRQINMNSTIHFLAGSATIRKECKPVIDELVKVCRNVHLVAKSFKLPPVHLRIEGHVAKTKNISKCKKLSLARAEKVRECILAGGTPASAIWPVGFGFSRGTGDRRYDRRVEVHIVEESRQQYMAAAKLQARFRGRAARRNHPVNAKVTNNPPSKAGGIVSIGNMHVREGKDALVHKLKQ